MTTLRPCLGCGTDLATSTSLGEFLCSECRHGLYETLAARWDKSYDPKAVNSWERLQRSLGKMYPAFDACWCCGADCGPRFAMTGRTLKLGKGERIKEFVAVQQKTVESAGRTFCSGRCAEANRQDAELASLYSRGRSEEVQPCAVNAEATF